MPRGDERTVVVQRRVGLGDLLLSNCAAWRFARATDRTLVIDWRQSGYAAPGTNLFTELFEPIDHWCGVPVHLPGDDEPWTRPPLMDAVREAADGEAACALIAAGNDLPDEHVRWVGCLAPAHPGRRQVAGLLRSLTPRPHLAAALAEARTHLLGDGSSIGVHLRHGNGGDILGHARYWTDGLTLHRVVGVIRRASEVLGAHTPVVVATDSAEVLDAVAVLVPGVRSLPKGFRAVGDGDLHLWNQAHTTLGATFVEMFLLAHTTVLVRMPPDSYFSAPAAFLKLPAPDDLLRRRPDGLEPTVW